MSKRKFDWDYFFGGLLVLITFVGSGVSIGFHLAGK